MRDPTPRVDALDSAIQEGTQAKHWLSEYSDMRKLARTLERELIEQERRQTPHHSKG